MPLPLVLIGIAAVSAAVGTKKGYDAASDHGKAKSLNQEAREVYDRAEAGLASSREEAKRVLEELGKLKLETWDQQLGRFVRLFEKLRNVELEGSAAVGSFAARSVSPGELLEMKRLSLKAAEVVKGGAMALGSGALVGVASYGGAMTFAAASTGTAIGSLSGAAAVNATLAWFGGGSLAAGGLGMAGGAAVLGGLVAGPVLAVGGIVLAAKAKEGLAQARMNLASAKRAAEEMKNAGSIVNGIRRLSRQFERVIRRVAPQMDAALDQLEAVISTAGADYESYQRAQRDTVFVAVQFAQVVKILLETPLLTAEGAIDGQCHKALEHARFALKAE